MDPPCPVAERLHTGRLVDKTVPVLGAIAAGAPAAVTAATTEGCATDCPTDTEYAISTSEKVAAYNG